MRITDLFENDDQSDAELFGTHGTNVDMRFRLADAFDEYARIRDEAVGEWHPSWRENNLTSLKHEQHVMGMARSLASIFRKQGLEPGLRMADSLFRHGDTRQYMWLYDAYDFLRDKKGIDMPEMVAQHFNESAEPSDEELFGDDLPTVLLREITKFFHASKDYLNEELRRLGYDSMQDLYNAVDMDDEQITEISYLNSDIRTSYALIQEFDKNPRAGVELFAEAYNGGLAHNPVLYNAESVAESIVDKLGDTTYQQLINYCNRNRIHIVHENAEPSDNELFGSSPSSAGIQDFVRIFDSILRDLFNDIANAETNDEADFLRYDYNEIQQVRDAFVRDGYYAGLRALKKKQSEGELDFFEMLNLHGINIDRVLRNLSEESEPSDEELFGKEEFPRAEIIKLLRDIGEYFHRTYDSEDLLDNADVVLDAADDFEKYGIKAGAERLIDVWSPHMMSYLTAMFRERLGFDLNKMFSRFVSDL